MGIFERYLSVWVGLCIIAGVLLGNVLRNTVLVAAQASGNRLPAWGHDTVGLVVLALVCSGIAWAMARQERAV